MFSLAKLNQAPYFWAAIGIKIRYALLNAKKKY